MNKLYCYMIVSKKNNIIVANYIGMTVNPSRRIRQHNSIIKGGAKATKKYNNWEFLFIIQGFKNKNETYSCEWKLKHPNNKYSSKITNRLLGIIELFKINNKFTSKCSIINKNDLYIINFNENFINIITNIIFINELNKNYNIITTKINLSNEVLLKYLF